MVKTIKNFQATDIKSTKGNISKAKKFEMETKNKSKEAYKNTD